MSRVLRQKVVAALVGYCQANAATLGISSSKIVPQTSTSEPELDYWVIAVTRAERDPELPEIWMLDVVVQLKSAGTPDGTERTAVDAKLDAMHTLLMQPPDDNATWSQNNPEAGVLLAALNKPASGTDSRAVKPLHIYDLYPADDSSGSHEEGWVDTLRYTVRAQPMDSH